MFEHNEAITRGNLRVYNERGMLLAEFLDFVMQSRRCGGEPNGRTAGAAVGALEKGAFIVAVGAEAKDLESAAIAVEKTCCIRHTCTGRRNSGIRTQEGESDQRI
ncbi:hypothetical protein [Paenibacillus elgii]|uniref:hypothetical protein n=1 Tax=Paenibacillus elgii TaxID=189691 RepID=UPI000248DAD3|nr:hypothetical protein [Paenibacillus elgii]